MSSLPQLSSIQVELLSMIKLAIFDFDGVFTDNKVYVSQEGIESVCCWRSDGIGLQRLRTIGVQSFVLSTEVNPVVTVRANKLKIRCWQGVKDKAEAIVKICQEYDVHSSEVAFIGNDINDIPAFKIVGIPIGVADGYLEIFPHVLFHTRKAGGHGAVREVCDLIYHAKNETLNKNNLESYVF